MTEQCCSCLSKPVDFDVYLCEKCARDFGIFNKESLRQFYQVSFPVIRTAISVYSGFLKKNSSARETDGGGPLAVAISPTITFQNARRFLYLDRLLRLVQDIQGDVVECGVGAGLSMLHIATICTDQYPHRNLWGFDSFEGFPQPQEYDRGSRESQKGDWSKSEHGHSVLKLLLDCYAMYGITPEWIQSHLTLVKGFFDKTLKDYPGDKIVLLHLDCDLYESYKTSLTELYPKVSVGGIIAVDEYLGTKEQEHYPGAKIAIEEYIADKQVKLYRDKYLGKYFFLKLA